MAECLLGSQGFIRTLYFTVFCTDHATNGTLQATQTRRPCGLKFDKLKSLHGIDEELFSSRTNDEIRLKIGGILSHVIGKRFIGSINSSEMDGLLLDLCQSTRQGLEELYNNSPYFKPSRLFLVVQVVEARELADKDVNGLSDPYCVLGIVLGYDEFSTLSSQASISSDNIGGLLQLGTEPTGALTVRRSRDSIIRHMITQDSASPVCTADADVLHKRLAFKGHRKPVKDVRRTSVKLQTLNPFWDERFQFELNDITTDQLELDIWDHDEETSIVDAVRSLNEVRGVKQLGRYFKQVSQTARKGQTGDVDDFLGSITIDLKKLPLDEVDQWIKLEGRSAKSKVQGEIHIRLKLTTVEDGSDEPKFGEMKDHIMLLYEMIICELKRSKKPSTEWSGELSAAAQWLLSQHAFQNGLSELQLAICSWICYSKVYRKMPIGCSIILARLQELTLVWSDKELEQEHLAYLTKSFEAFTEHALMLLTQCRVVFSQERPETLSHYENLLCCLQVLHNSRPFQFCLPFSTTLQCELTAAIKKRAVTNYELFKKIAEVPEGKAFGHIMNVDIRRMVIHLTNLTDDLRAADTVYSPVMQRQVGVFLQDLLHRTYTKLLHRELFEDGRLGSLVGNILNTAQNKMQDGVEPEHKLDQDMLELFSLFHAIQKFELFESSRIDNEEPEPESFDWYSWFQPVFSIWVQRCGLQLQEVVEKDLRQDQLAIPPRKKKSVVSRTREEQSSSPPGTLEELPMISPSAQKLMDDMRAMLFTWIECCWPGVETYGVIAKMVLEKLFDSAISYARNLHEKLRLKGYCDEEGQFDISPQLCMALSALDRVIIWTQTIPESCGWSRRKSCASGQPEEKSRLLDEARQSSPTVPRLERIPREDLQALYEIQRSGVIEIRHVLDRIFYRVTAKMRPEIRKNVYHLCWCASTSPTEKALNDLLVYLESNIDTLRRQVSTGLLRRCYLELWSECLEQFIEQAHKEAEVAPGIGGPGAYLNPPDSASTPNTLVIPLSTHFTESQSPDAPNLVDPETVLRAKSTLLKLKHATELLLQFFMRTTNGLLEKYELENETYQDINYLIQLYVSSTPELVELYFAEKMEEQDKTSRSSYGTLSVSVSLQHSELIVEVRNASGLLPLDSNGLSDPFVVVDLLPRHIFKVSPRQMRTRIVKNSLDPIFNEQFEFTATEVELRHPSACLAFVIMDHDILLSDDLEGVSFLRLSTLFEPRREGSCRQGPSLNCVLPVLHPTHKKYSAFRVLSQRTDQYAQEVYKRWQPVEQDGSS